MIRRFAISLLLLGFSILPGFISHTAVCHCPSAIGAKLATADHVSVEERVIFFPVFTFVLYLKVTYLYVFVSISSEVLVTVGFDELPKIGVKCIYEIGSSFMYASSFVISRF